MKRRLTLSTLIVAFGLALYSGFLLIPEWWPGVRTTTGYFVYAVTLPFTLLALVILGGWGAVGLCVSLARHVPRQTTHRTMLVISMLGLLLLGAAYGLSTTIRGGLPSGSNLRKFEPAEWKDAASSFPDEDGISIRQKMLGDVVRHLSGSDRRELEERLGPSLETPFFASSGRDLIYLLGRERDSMFGVDSEWLLIWLDGTGRFERYEVWTD